MKKITIIVALTAFTVGICFIILGSISVELMTGLGISAAQFGTLVMGFFLTGGIVQLFIGPLVDKVGYKPVTIYGIIFAVGLLGGTFVPKFIGNLSVGSTVQQSLPIAAIMAVILLVISLFIGRVGKRNI